MSLSKRFGITGRFIAWFLFVSIVPVFIVGYLSYTNSHHALEAQTEEELVALSDILEQHVITLISEQKNSVEALSKIRTLSQYKELGVYDAQVELSAFFSIQDDFYEYFLLDDQGVIIASTNIDSIGLNKANDDYYVGAKDKMDTHIKDVYISSANQEKNYVISTPVFDLSGVFVGVVAGRVDIARLNSVMATINETGETVKAHLVNSDGYVITATRFGGEEDILTLKGDSAAVKGVFESGVERTGTNVDYRNKEVLGSFMIDHLRNKLGLDWVLVAEVDMEEIDAPVIALRDQIVWIAIIVIIAILFLSVIASRMVGGYIKKPIVKAAEQMGAASDQLSASSQQTSAASQQNASISQQVAAGATQQSRQAEEISQAVATMSSAIQQMSASSQEAASEATESSQMAQKTGESAEKIVEMVDTITNIAEQTNMLALNAAIEAARAGEAGRGFAVVADEVRKLAESSGQSAEEIKEIVSNIGESMTSTVTSVQGVSSKIQEVAASIQQQASAIQQIAKTMDSVAAVAEQNASGAQQLSASTQQQSAANQQVAAAAQQLQALAKDMKSLAGLVEKMDRTVTQSPVSTVKTPVSEKKEVTPEVETTSTTEEK